MNHPIGSINLAGLMRADVYSNGQGHLCLRIFIKDQCFGSYVAEDHGKSDLIRYDPHEEHEEFQGPGQHKMHLWSLSLTDAMKILSEDATNQGL